jgi:hypothetical protein
VFFKDLVGEGFPFLIDHFFGLLHALVVLLDVGEELVLVFDPLRFEFEEAEEDEGEEEAAEEGGGLLDEIEEVESQDNH